MRYITAIILLFLSVTVFSQAGAPAPYGVLPSARQLKWHETEMYVIMHFTPTTFENKEWGYGDADPSIFNPTDFNPDQIVKSVKAGGFRGFIMVAKHHDGFCLWPTKTTPYNISKSPWKNGKGDMVKEFQLACKNNGIKFGVYCSPWDRNNPAYGTEAYVQTYRNQLKELYSNYGDLFISWHDGANGGDGYYGGARETRKIDRSVYYGWDTTWAITRKMQPGASIFSDVGWDVRWVGNERGEAAATSWATFTPTPLEGKTKVGPGEVRDDLSPEGTRNGQFWIPAECDVPLRKGWFYHPEEDSTVKSPAKLFDLYLKSVGRGAALDLGISPDKRGQLHDNDVKNLAALGKIISSIYKENLASKASIRSSNTRNKDSKNFGVARLTDNNMQTYWCTDDDVTNPDLTLEWKSAQTVNIIRLRENIALGQRIEEVVCEAWVDGNWKEIATVTSIGASRIIYLENPVTTVKLRVRITKSPVVVTLSELGVYYLSPGQLK